MGYCACNWPLLPRGSIVVSVRRKAASRTRFVFGRICRRRLGGLLKVPCCVCFWSFCLFLILCCRGGKPTRPSAGTHLVTRCLVRRFADQICECCGVIARCGGCRCIAFDRLVTAFMFGPTDSRLTGKKTKK